MTLSLDYDVTITHAPHAVLQALARLLQSTNTLAFVNTARIAGTVACSSVLDGVRRRSPELYGVLVRSSQIAAIPAVYCRAPFEGIEENKLVGLKRQTINGVRPALVDDDPRNVSAARKAGYTALETPIGITWTTLAEVEKLRPRGIMRSRANFELPQNEHPSRRDRSSPHRSAGDDEQAVQLLPHQPNVDFGGAVWRGRRGNLPLHATQAFRQRNQRAARRCRRAVGQRLKP